MQKPPQPPFVFDPPLPHLWSTYNIQPSQLKSTLQGKQANELYDKIFSTCQPCVVPHHPYGNSATKTVPLLSLGGMVGLRKTLRKNTLLRFRVGPIMCRWLAKNFFICNGVVVPLLLLFSLVWFHRFCSRDSFPVSLVVAFGASFLWWLTTGWMLLSAHQLHLDQLVNFAHGAGMTHIETAQQYNDSEAQLNPVLSRQRQKGNRSWMIQTKIKPNDTKHSFYHTSIACMKTLGVQRLDCLTIHGINKRKHVDMCLHHTISELQQLKAEGKVDLIGFSGHGQTKVLEKMIHLQNKGGDHVFDFINLHFGFFSSYTNIDNQSAVLAAKKAGLGVYCISPSNQGGELHKPSAKLIDLCQPLHPLEFGLLYLMTHQGIGDTGTVSCGPTTVHEFDYQLRAIRLLPYAKALLPPIVQKLRRELRQTLGQKFCNGLAERVGGYTMGNEEMPGMPGGLNLCMLMSCYGLWKTFDSESYVVRMVGGLKMTNSWRTGGGINVLRGKKEGSNEMKQFRTCLRSGVGGKEQEDQLSADALLSCIREMEKLFPLSPTPFPTRSLLSCSVRTSMMKMLKWGYTTYYKYYIGRMPQLFGYYQTKVVQEQSIRQGKAKKE
jgi:predicted aldo/keto reductase-like oxidoreductase